MVRQKQIGVGDHDSGNHVSGPPRVGVSDFPISKDMPLTGVWNHEPNANGPVITAIQGALDISRAPVKAANQYTSLSIQHQLQVQGGTIITFKVKYDFIHVSFVCIWRMLSSRLSRCSDLTLSLSLPRQQTKSNLASLPILSFATTAITLVTAGGMKQSNGSTSSAAPPSKWVAPNPPL